MIRSIGLLLFPLFAAVSLAGAGEWPHWRGPLGTGVAPGGSPPIRWSEEQNLRFKTPLPGLGHSTPVIWGDRIFLTTAEPHGKPVEAHRDHDHDDGAHDNLPPERRLRFIVMAIDRRDGRVLWKRTVRDAVPREGTHETGSWASASPVTDGRHLWASFGSNGLYCLNMKGKLVWERDLGPMRSRHGHGEGSSPALHGNTLVVNWDHQGDSFLIALDKRTGRQRWRVARDEITSWSTPLIVEHAGKVQVVVAATGRVRGYDLADGKVIWECAGLSRNVVASPVAADGRVFVANSYDWRKMLAIDLDRARGDITGTEAVLWSRDRDTPYVPSPLLLDGTLYFLKHNHGIWTAVDAATGTEHYGPERLPGMRSIFASPTAAAGRIYVVGRSGNAVVLAAGKRFEVLARNRLDDTFSASPVIVGDTLYLRGERHLYALAESER